MPALFIDGMYMGPSGNTDLRDYFQLDAIEGIEIYRERAFAPAELVQRECGSIAVWTRATRGDPLTLRRFATAAGFVILVVLVRAL
jgi:hypothetical protein